jgi:hypothetical protein
MPEINPDMSEQYRCISVHWSLPVQCVLPCTHRENWHEAWHPGTGNRIRYRRSFGTFRTEELNGDDWTDLEIPPPSEITAASDADRNRICNEIVHARDAAYEGRSGEAVDILSGLLESLR